MGAYWMGEVTTSYDIVEHAQTLLNNIGWTTLDSSTTTYSGNIRVSYIVVRGQGDGNDNIYLQLRAKDVSNVLLDSMVGFDNKLYWYEQPGSIQHYLGKEEQVDGTIRDVAQPMFSMAGESECYCWLFATDYMLIGVVRMSTVYESFYMGLINPVSTEKQYPYPMYVAGNAVATGSSWPNNITGSFVFPTGGSGYLRRVDGTWRKFNAVSDRPDPSTIGTIFPYNTGNYKLVDNYRGVQTWTQDDMMLFPVILQTTDPIDLCGLLYRVYWISGACDISAQQTLVFNGETYIIFDTKSLRSGNSYFVIKMIASDD